MTSVGEEEVEYESDPEEIKRSLAMRRREASDDEEGEGEGEDDKSRIDRRAGIHSDESDGQGGAAEYDDDEEVLDMDEEEEEEIYDEEEEEEEEEIDEEEVEGDKKEMDRNNERGGASGTGGLAVVKEVEGDGGRNLEEAMDGHVGKLVEEEQEKKENEPFAVPTAGAFYMHDDRFRDNAGGRHRRTHVGRKLWESKDDKKWGHDKFEEMNLQERHYEEGRRSSRGRYRARGKNRGPDRGYPRGSRAKAFNGSNNQNQLPKGGMRGRGPRRSEPGTKNSGQASSTQNKQMGKALEKTLQTNTGRALMPTTESASAPAKKHVFASSLSSASPPFYPSGSSNKEINLTQKRDLQAGGVSRNLRTSVMDENFSVPQANALLRGKNIVDSAGLDKLYIDDSSSSAAGKTLNNLQMPSSGHSSVNTTQSSQSRAQGRHITGQMPYQSGSPNNQVNRVSVPAQHYNVQRGSVQSRIQSSSQATGQQSGQRPGSGSQASSPPKTALSISSYEAGEVESSETGKSKGTLVGKGKGSIPGSGRGSFLYNGAQVTGAAGNVAVGHGDQNFPATPAFLPVMQFGGQHPGGIGVPAVGMAFPGYVAQPQLGLGNSEMTWLPVLAGAAGALGATYCSPYIAVDGSYHARPAGQTSSIGSSSKENNTNKPNSEWKPSQRPEPLSDEFGQRQNNPNKQPRRYSEMSFSK